MTNDTNTTRTTRTTNKPSPIPSTTPELSVLKSLRALMPTRVLSYAEALSRAELQAAKLLELSGIRSFTGPVPIEIVIELPRIRVEQAFDLPVSGSAHWDGGAWVLTINAAEFDLRQRFSIMHEFKHVLDHPTRHLIQRDASQKLSASAMAEKVADYFAACVLMPKAWVKAAFCNQAIQNIEQLAALFRVSPRAMSFRLSQLGLTVPAPRCLTDNSVESMTSTNRPSASRFQRRTVADARRSWSSRSLRRYHRALSLSAIPAEGVPA